MTEEFKEFKRYADNATKAIVCADMDFHYAGYVMAQPMCDIAHNIGIMWYMLDRAELFHADEFNEAAEIYDETMRDFNGLWAKMTKILGKNYSLFTHDHE